MSQTAKPKVNNMCDVRTHPYCTSLSVIMGTKPVRKLSALKHAPEHVYQLVEFVCMCVEWRVVNFICIYTKAMYLHIAYYWATFIPSINNRIGRQFGYNETIECDATWWKAFSFPVCVHVFVSLFFCGIIFGLNVLHKTTMMVDWMRLPSIFVVVVGSNKSNRSNITIKHHCILFLIYSETCPWWLCIVFAVRSIW